MATTANPHSLSVFTNSCRSTPRDPRTRLPADSLDQHKKRHQNGGQARFLTSSASRQPRAGLPELRATQPYASERPATAPAAATRSLAEEEEDEGVGLNYSTLFATLLESNALLRDEIQQMRQEHSRAMSALELLRKEHRSQVYVQTSSKLEASGRIMDPHSLREVEGSLREGVPSPPAEDHRLSRSLPAQPLKDAWLPPETLPTHSPPPEPEHQREEVLHSPSSLGSTQDPSELVERGSPLAPASFEGEEDCTDDQSEGIGRADSGTMLDSSVHSDPAASGGGLKSSSVSLSGSSSTSESEGDAQTTGNGDPFAPHGLVTIESMWDDFSVEDYAPYLADREEMRGKEEWRPRITIPQPFSMTLREENTPKKKSKSMLSAEREKMEREAKEEAEMRKQFRATPVPASTYIPLYELINAKNQERRERVKHRSKDLLESTERPFSFMKREEEKKRLKAEAFRLRHPTEEGQAVMFRAQPVPKHLFDPQVNEQIREEEEYRRIRVKMRAEEMLAKSKLPGSMQVKGREYTDGALRRKRLKDKQKRAFMTREHSFRPRINPRVPDYDQLFLDFQRELARRKNCNQTTTTEPFYLRTQLISSRKELMKQELQQDGKLLPRATGPHGRSSGASSTHLRSSSAPYPVQLTETAKIRQSLTQERLAVASERETAEEQERERKRDQQRELQRAVSQKSMAHDPTAWLEERKKQKFQEFRSVQLQGAKCSAACPLITISILQEIGQGASGEVPPRAAGNSAEGGIQTSPSRSTFPRSCTPLC